MNEQETTEETESEESTEDNDERSKSETTPLIEIAEQAAKRMEDANKETARLMGIQAERDQRIALGGETEAGQTPKKKEEEVNNKDYAKDVLAGKLNEKSE